MKPVQIHFSTCFVFLQPRQFLPDIGPQTFPLVGARLAASGEGWNKGCVLDTKPVWGILADSTCKLIISCCHDTLSKSARELTNTKLWRLSVMGRMFNCVQMIDYSLLTPCHLLVLGKNRRCYSTSTQPLHVQKYPERSGSVESTISQKLFWRRGSSDSCTDCFDSWIFIKPLIQRLKAASTWRIMTQSLCVF